MFAAPFPPPVPPCSTRRTSCGRSTRNSTWLQAASEEFTLAGILPCFDTLERFQLGVQRSQFLAQGLGAFFSPASALAIGLPLKGKRDLVGQRVSLDPLVLPLLHALLQLLVVVHECLEGSGDVGLLFEVRAKVVLKGHQSKGKVGT